MTIILPALVIAFAAFCVWFGVRIFNRRERWAKWIAVGLTLALIAYPLSYGLVYRAAAQGLISDGMAGYVLVPYVPLLALAGACDPVNELLQWYLRLLVL